MVHVIINDSAFTFIAAGEFFVSFGVVEHNISPRVHINAGENPNETNYS